MVKFLAEIINKLFGFIGFENEPDENTEPENNTQEEKKPVINPGKKGQIVSLHTHNKMQVVVFEPDNYDDEVQIISNHLKSHRQVIINLEQTEQDLARRIVDFVSGVTFALDGNMKKVGQSIFLFVPSNVDIDSDEKEQLKEQAKDKNFFANFMK